MIVKAILFDLDGTLVDTSEFIYQAYEHTLSLHKHKVVQRKTLAPHIGRGLSAIYKDLAPMGNNKNLIETHNSFQEDHFYLVKSFSNVLKVINELRKKGFKIGIVTSRYKNTPKTLDAAGINTNLFDVIITGDIVTKPKPDPEGIILALDKLKIKPEEAIFVGDAIVDIQMGKNAKVKTVGVTYGFGGKAIAESKPDYMIDEITDLLGLEIKKSPSDKRLR